MLQQTQVVRVDGRWQRWLERFPTVDALAAASSADVLEEWQGLGYNRRAIALLHARAGGVRVWGRGAERSGCPRGAPGRWSQRRLRGVRAFAFDLPAAYLETNVRTVFLHDLFPHVRAGIRHSLGATRAYLLSS